MKLPEYVKNKPEPIQKKWTNLYTEYAKEGEAIGLGVANKWLSNYKPVVVENFVFSADKEQLTARSIGGVEYYDFLLADNRYDNYGTKYSETFLKELAEMINNGDIGDGDFNHDTLNKLIEAGYTKDSLKEKFKSLKQGVAKAIKAIYENGKLYLRTLIDPAYKERVQNAKGISIEGSFVREGDTFVGGKILGFSIIDDPKKDIGNPRARRLK
jgi:hypothetical protein